MAGVETTMMAQSKGFVNRIVREGLLIIAVVTCAYMGLALATYHQDDPGWSQTGIGSQIHNAGGPAGAWIADVSFSLFGVLALIFPVMLAFQAWRLLREKGNPLLHPLMLAIRTAGLLLILVAGSGLAVQYGGQDSESFRYSIGGLVGLATSASADSVFGFLGGSLLLLAIFLFGLTIFIDLSWISLMDVIGAEVLKFYRQSREKLLSWQRTRSEKKEVAIAVNKRKENIKEHTKKQEKRKPPTITALPKASTSGKRVQKEKQQSLFDAPVTGELPAIALLDPARGNVEVVRAQTQRFRYCC